MIKTHGKSVGRSTTKTTVFLPLLSAGFYPDGNSPGKHLENSGKQNPKMGFKSPPEQRRKFGKLQFATNLIDRARPDVNLERSSSGTHNIRSCKKSSRGIGMISIGHPIAESD
jgi:hypothetical protein